MAVGGIVAAVEMVLVRAEWMIDLHRDDEWPRTRRMTMMRRNDLASRAERMRMEVVAAAGSVTRLVVDMSCLFVVDMIHF